MGIHELCVPGLVSKPMLLAWAIGQQRTRKVSYSHRSQSDTGYSEAMIPGRDLYSL